MGFFSWWTDGPNVFTTDGWLERRKNDDEPEGPMDGLPLPPGRHIPVSLSGTEGGG